MPCLRDGHCQEVSVDLGVQIEDVADFLVGFFLADKGRVPFLPKELPGPDEGGRVAEFPSNYVGPLVELKGKISPAAYPLHVPRNTQLTVHSPSIFFGL